ncbi:MAG: hypothetical protein GY820_41500 [Gammaproteobacteria bacterium]|nr:hypothetical protein [Gammaproteobacteria bacterium]
MSRGSKPKTSCYNYYWTSGGLADDPIMFEAPICFHNTKVPKLNTRMLITGLHLRHRAGASESMVALRGRS